MSVSQVEISKYEIDPNRLSDFLKTPLPDFALSALHKNGFDQPRSEANNAFHQHNLLAESRQTRCKLTEHFSAVAKHFNSDGGRIWDRRDVVFHSSEHNNQSAGGGSADH